MPHHFRPYPPEQPLLLPPDLRDWLPEDHLVYTVSELVDALESGGLLCTLHAAGLRQSPVCTRHDGEDFGLWPMPRGYWSSRRLAQKLEEDVAFRVLAAGNRPQHRTLCEFRPAAPRRFRAVLVAVVQLARDLGPGVTHHVGAGQHQSAR